MPHYLQRFGAYRGVYTSDTSRMKRSERARCSPAMSCTARGKEQSESHQYAGASVESRKKYRESLSTYPASATLVMPRLSGSGIPCRWARLTKLTGKPEGCAHDCGSYERLLIDSSDDSILPARLVKGARDRGLDRKTGAPSRRLEASGRRGRRPCPGASCRSRQSSDTPRATLRGRES